MNIYKKKLKAEFIKILKESDKDEIRNFFRASENLDEMVVKCVLWGHHFMPKYFSKPTPDFHYNLVKRFFRAGNDYTACPRGFAKDYWVETPTLTNEGFKKLKDIKVGDFVFGEDGKQTKVIKKTEIFYDRNCYSVKFSDGSEIIAGETHDWLVEDSLLRHRIDYVPRNGKKETVKSRKGTELLKKTTKELSEKLFINKNGKREVNYSIPVCKPVEFVEKAYEIDPYFLGQWLGDGTTKAPHITTMDEETVEYIYEYADRMGYKVRVIRAGGKSNTYCLSGGLQAKLKEVGVFGNKHIPDEYKFGSVEQRLALLQGLLDSDGTISKAGHSSFTSTNKNLAYDTLYLILSLGIKATIRNGIPKIGDKKCSRYYEINFTTNLEVFKLGRKKDRLPKFYSRNNRRYIVAVDKVKSVPTQCLAVDNDSHLFLAGKELIPTHNTTMNQLCIFYSCVNGLDEFIVLIEKTWNEASEVLEALREEAKLNDEIVRVYGDLTKVNAKGKDQEGIRDSTGDFFINGVRLRAKGFDSPIRGLKSRHSRPTRVILDDIESDEHIDNVEQRAKYLNNYIKGVIPAVDNDTGVIKMWGTILHDDSLLNTLINNHNGRVYAAWDKEHVLLWSSNWTVDKLEKKREEMRISEKGDAGFYQEYFNQPISEEDQIFRKEMFRYFKGLDLEEIKKKPHHIYTLVDPAISKKTTADFTAIISVLVDSMNKVFVLEITRARLDPIETIKAVFAHYEKWQPLFVGIETVSYQKALKYFIEEEKRRASSTVQSMQIKEIVPTIDKVTKIKKLQPKYAIANVFHNSDDKNTEILEQELTRFPKAAHDDCCFVAGTKILTDVGNKNIEDIEIGDLVMTRAGFSKVECCFMTGEKEVISNVGLTGTYNHPVIVKKLGMDCIKHLTLVSPSDTLHIWNETLLYIEEKSIIDTLIQKGDSLGNIFGVTINGRSHRFHFIVKFGLIILAKYLKNIAFTIRTETHSIMMLKILNLFPFLNIPVTMLKNPTESFNQRRTLKLQGSLQKNGMDQSRGKSGTLNIVKIFGEIANLFKSVVFNAVKNLYPKMVPENIVHHITEINLEKKTEKDLKEVYNIQVESDHEFFANGILVHNCDCLSNIIEIMIPVSKTVDRNYKKYMKARVDGSTCMY